MPTLKCRLTHNGKYKLLGNIQPITHCVNSLLLLIKCVTGLFLYNCMNQSEECKKKRYI